MGPDALLPVVPDPPPPPDDSSARRSTALLRLADRTRTIDQVKRLYAVVMGLAISSCFSATYQAFKFMSGYDVGIIGIVASEFITFTSLIVLFYLGAERMLDSKYLNIGAKAPPRPINFLFDLCSLGVTAALFVGLADTLPDQTDLTHNGATLSYFISRQRIFLEGLIFLYVVDLFILLVQICILYTRKILKDQPGQDESIWAHWCWVLSNLLCLLIFCPIALYSELDKDISCIGVNLLSVLLLIVHSVRFLFDYFLAFAFYYPNRHLPETDDLFTNVP